MSIYDGVWAIIILSYIVLSWFFVMPVTYTADLSIGDCVRQVRYQGLNYEYRAPYRIKSIGKNIFIVEVLDTEGKIVRLDELSKNALAWDYEKVVCLN